MIFKKERKNVKEPCERERASLSIRCSSRTIRIHRRLRFPTISLTLSSLPISSPPSMKSHRNLSCYGKENARMHCIHCSSLARGGQCGIWHQWQWLRSYLEGIVFRYTPERVVSKGFFLMLREANLKELPVGSKYHFCFLRYGKL
ncbi:hypothetical protein OIU74_003747 [Salix koriyanagi]|uniref:Uncharacterized protein n=1 Tax=Salix koriyanagi TaxID=2511006 RepID=A0A9Q0UZ82_9ROSI|nr:hypothetical protein OIU74_003747 [Salix koriyanagi]